ncbi:MarR family winged helix-turn-helix transcriptional regulator [Hoeflea ulvae]|uniref:MarR family transcriptional regulator n=1 Tax=Hoeflea ulvae TaxID=2983764 RepID=A0ABT3YCZ8_9HYPH|nr:MarR family transcriptional regulator [Hoeflea ulvae]MCY0093738.1 MarR family transcriptional regulator [Hoeflea ulvae]
MTKRATDPAGKDEQLAQTRLRQFVGYEMKMAYLLIQQDMLRILKPTGLRIVTFSALGIVVENPDISQTQLAQALQIERSGVVVIVDELENADLISRNKVEGDRRSYALRATLKGRNLWSRTEKRVHEHEDGILSALSGAERETLKLLLGRIIEDNRNR